MPQMFPSSIVLVFMFVFVMFSIFLISVYWQVLVESKHLTNSQNTSEGKKEIKLLW